MGPSREIQDRHLQRTTLAKPGTRRSVGMKVLELLPSLRIALHRSLVLHPMAGLYFSNLSGALVFAVRSNIVIDRESLLPSRTRGSPGWHEGSRVCHRILERPSPVIGLGCFQPVAGFCFKFGGAGTSQRIQDRTRPRIAFTKPDEATGWYDRGLGPDTPPSRLVFIFHRPPAPLHIGQSVGGFRVRSNVVIDREPHLPDRAGESSIAHEGSRGLCLLSGTPFAGHWFCTESMTGFISHPARPVVALIRAADATISLSAVPRITAPERAGRQG
jgi:hypothetical protein